MKPESSRIFAKAVFFENKVSLEDFVRMIEHFEGLVLNRIRDHRATLPPQGHLYGGLYSNAYTEIDFASNVVRLGLHIMEHCF